MKKITILDSKQINKKIQRLSIEIFERNFKEKKILLVGIKENGSILAKMLIKELKKICKIKVEFAEIRLNKSSPKFEEINISSKILDYLNNSVIVVDDVCSSGKTLMYVTSHIMKNFQGTISTLVLVDRKHHNFPIKADYVGIGVSTTLLQFIEVDLEKNKTVYLY